MRDALLRPASREALAAARTRLDQTLGELDSAGAQRLGEELFETLRLLAHEVPLRRHLSDPATAESSRTGLLTSLLSGKVGERTVETLTGLVAARWSVTRDLLDAVEMLARLAVLGAVEKDGVIDDVEDELFRFGRLLDREPQLRTLLADTITDAERRVELLESVITGKVHTATELLLRYAVRVPRGRSLDDAATDMAELAAERRDRYVAHVTTPLALSAQQEQRLVAALSRIYRRDITLQVEYAPELLGGLRVRVGDEVIDGSIAERLRAARQQLPR